MRRKKVVIGFTSFTGEFMKKGLIALICITALVGMPACKRRKERAPKKVEAPKKAAPKKIKAAKPMKVKAPKAKK